MHQERLDEHAPTTEIVNADAPLRPVLLTVQFIHDADRDLDRPAGKMLGTPNVPANPIEDERVAVGGVSSSKTLHKYYFNGTKLFITRRT